MIITSFFLPFALPTLNELEAARGKIADGQRAGDATRWNAYNARKRQLQADVVAHLLAARVAKIPHDQRVRLSFFWHCADRRTDPDNVAAGGRKIILDAMKPTRQAGRSDRHCVGAGIIHCDGWHCVAGFSDHFISEARFSRVGVRVQIEAAG